MASHLLLLTGQDSSYLLLIAAGVVLVMASLSRLAPQDRDGPPRQLD